MANLRQVFHDIAESIRAKGITGEFKPVDMASKIGQIKITDYLIFTAEEATTLTLVQNGNIAAHKLLKSTDGGINWVKWDNPSTNGIHLNAGESVYIKDDEDASNTTATSDSDFNSYSSTGRIKCNGSLMPEISLNPGTKDYSYFVSKLFRDCSKLTKAPELPSKILANNCYYGTFANCSSLVEAPELPATTLANNCYFNMFYGCTSLTTPPELPATTLATYCYSQMFRGCTSLTTAPELPATDLVDYCYSYMFQNCTSLTTAPQLPATTFNQGCYEGMFNGCTSLTTAPELPATTLVSNCYAYMFSACSSLTKAPELPATTLANYCYYYMFSGCTSLTTAPELPATTLAERCYDSMFKGCTSLTTAPELPATTLVSNCYAYMFKVCTSLKRIKMNASSGNWGTNMFNGCTSLELVDMTGSTGVPQLSNVNNFANTNDTYKIVVPDSLYDTWIAATNWASIASHIMKKSDWNAAHPDDILP